ncbi:putative vacuolar amino acid transporter [Lachnellula suecica]|uniref:Putative vacuolar amino acid transporter n=1 Tax=Lachnellula suecica TaxID=602035 RepID=A0A8T9CH56_9HELO|nr:putative vacuolar amino acid transporter [Lachnellula suecica]
MAPSMQPLNLDIEAISGIMGSVSIACWIVVFGPQIIENFRRRSAEGLSTKFIVIWSLGDVFNVLGCILQGVIPTMIILAIYYLLADIVLLSQCLTYRGFTWSDTLDPPKPSQEGEADESTGLLRPPNGQDRSISAEHLSPAVPFLDGPAKDPKPTTRLEATLFNSVAILMVCLAGVFGWWLSSHNPHHAARQPKTSPDEPQFSVLGQTFGYICAALYLGSRAPQLWLNYSRQSTDGISLLFFLFACIGNLTFVLSIFAYEAHCAGTCPPGEKSRLYGRYIAVNASWLAGSLGTLLLDLFMLGQFFVYREREEEEMSDEESVDRDHRPLLDRDSDDDE